MPIISICLTHLWWKGFFLLFVGHKAGDGARDVKRKTCFLYRTGGKGGEAVVRTSTAGLFCFPVRLNDVGEMERGNALGDNVLITAQFIVPLLARLVAKRREDEIQGVRSQAGLQAKQ